MTTMIPDDEIRTVRLTAADAATRDSRVIAAKIDVHPSSLTKLGFDELLAAAEATDRELEARFARGDMPEAMALGLRLENLALRVACGTPGGWSEVERRIRLLYGIRKALPDGCALRVMLDVVIEADCLEWDVLVTDRSSGRPRLH